MATPDWEDDVIARIVALQPSAGWKTSGLGTNLVGGMEYPIGSELREGLTVVRYVTERIHYTCDGEERDVDLQIMTRFRMQASRAERETAITTARTMRTACHRKGNFTGQAPVSMSYADLLWVNGPQLLEPCYCFSNITLYARG